MGGSCCSASKQNVQNPTIVKKKQNNLENQQEGDKIEYDTQSLLTHSDQMMKQLQIGQCFFDGEVFLQIQAYSSIKQQKLQEQFWENIIQKYTVKDLSQKDKQQKEQNNINKYFFNKQHLFVYQFSLQETKLFNSLLASTPPHKYRWAAWKAKMFDESIYEKDYYEILASYKSKRYDDIKKDTNRGFSEHPFFQNQNSINMQGSDEDNSIGQEQLLRILNAISNYFPELGYTQGMHLVVGFPLIISGGNEQETFWFFVNLCLNTNFNILGFFEQDFPLLHFFLYIFDDKFEKKLPNLHKHMKNSMISEFQWIFSWIMTMFLYSFPINLCVYLWDFILSENNFSIISLALGILDQLEPHILKMDQFEFSSFLKELKKPHVLTKENSEFCLDFPKLIKFAKGNLIQKQEIKKYTDNFKKHTPLVQMDVNNKYVKFYSLFNSNQDEAARNLRQDLENNQGIISKQEVLRIKNSPESPLKLQNLQNNNHNGLHLVENKETQLVNIKGSNTNSTSNFNNNNKNNNNINNEIQIQQKNSQTFDKKVNLIEFDNISDKNNLNNDLQPQTIQIKQTPIRNNFDKSDNNYIYNSEKHKSKEKQQFQFENNINNNDIIQEEKQENNNNENEENEKISNINFNENKKTIQLVNQISMHRDSSNTNNNPDQEPLQLQSPLKPLQDNQNIFNIQQKQSSYENDEDKGGKQVQFQQQQQQLQQDQEKENDKEENQEEDEDKDNKEEEDQKENQEKEQNDEKEEEEEEQNDKNQKSDNEQENEVDIDDNNQENKSDNQNQNEDDQNNDEKDEQNDDEKDDQNDEEDQNNNNENNKEDENKDNSQEKDNQNDQSQDKDNEDNKSQSQQNDEQENQDKSDIDDQENKNNDENQEDKDEKSQNDNDNKTEDNQEDEQQDQEEVDLDEKEKLEEKNEKKKDTRNPNNTIIPVISLQTQNKIENKQYENKWKNQTDLFTDTEFQPDEKSICKNKNEFPQSQKIHSWLRASECYKGEEVHVFFEKIEPADILQGALGDCYFLSSLSVIAEHENLIRRLFDQQQISKNGCYAVWLCHDGEWKQVVLDDYLPANQNKSPVFSRGNGNELWVQLLEKAYAKIYGTFEKIEAGLTVEAIRDLTGAPGFSKKNYPQKHLETWNLIIENDKKGYLLTAGSQQDSKGKEIAQTSGIISGHAYAILDAQEVENPQGKKEKIVKLRNPWGTHEWNGAWSDNSDKWTDKSKQQVGLSNEDDGIFWMPVQDFCIQYSELSINKLHEKYFYTSKRIKIDKKMQVFSLNLKENTHGFLSITQKDKRNFVKESNEKDYEYSSAKIVICDKKNKKLIKCGSEIKRNTDIEINLEKNIDYQVYISMDWVQNFHKEIVVSFYNESKDFNLENCKFEEVTDNQEFYDILDNSILQNYKTDTKTSDLEFIKVYSETIAGYLYYVYDNQTENEHMSLDLDLSQNQHLALIFKDKNKNEKKLSLELKLKSQTIVKYEIMPEGKGAYSFNVQMSYSKKKVLSDEDLLKEAKANPESKLGIIFPNVERYMHLHSDGLFIHYSNKDKEKVYHEQLELNLKGMEGDGFDAFVPYEIKLQPESTLILKCKITGSSYGFQPQSTGMYHQKDEEEKKEEEDDEQIEEDEDYGSDFHDDDDEH